MEGIAYGSTVYQRGWNVALFTTPEELGLAKPEWGQTLLKHWDFIKLCMLFRRPVSGVGQPRSCAAEAESQAKADDDAQEGW